MKKFRFSLDPVLDHRERIEEEKKRVVGGCERELQAAQAELARLDGEFKRYSQVLRDGHTKLGSDELRRHYTHLEFLDRSITMQYGVIAQRRAALERARTTLLQASKERKVIEKLKTKRFEEHRAVEVQLEQKELDDANNRRYRPHFSC